MNNDKQNITELNKNKYYVTWLNKNNKQYYLKKYLKN